MMFIVALAPYVIGGVLAMERNLAQRIVSSADHHLPDVRHNRLQRGVSIPRRVFKSLENGGIHARVLNGCALGERRIEFCVSRAVPDQQRRLA